MSLELLGRKPLALHSKHVWYLLAVAKEGEDRV
jgi:hypothetical protein